jgi:predicted XRE-type DNA-binding protein
MTSLSFDEAVDVWLRHRHGDLQHKIAASYGVNQGRNNEVLKEKIHIGSKQIAASKRSA